MNPITLNGDWVQSVKDSIPDHSKDIKLNIDAKDHHDSVFKN